ncbi:MAG: hypothetical protein HQ495_13280 [Alphaproteobacteria bacterium]|nr:hypothetical protein [Alphaproteobacteria bacterium]
MDRIRERVAGLILALLHFLDLRRLGASHILPSELADLPIVAVVEHGIAPKYLAVFLSGDGGWASLPHRVSVHLSRRGIPVVGLNVRRYFRQRRGPVDLARDLERILRVYGAIHRCDNFVLIGFSFGAGALPFGVGALAESTRARLRLMALLSPIADAEFVFDWWAWLRFDVLGLAYVAPPGSPAVAPILESLQSVPQLMVFGSGELGSRKPWGAAAASRIVLRGGHHLGHRYRRLADAIVTAVDATSDRSC